MIRWFSHIHLLNGVKATTRPAHFKSGLYPLMCISGLANFKLSLPPSSNTTIKTGLCIGSIHVRGPCKDISYIIIRSIEYDRGMRMSCWDHPAVDVFTVQRHKVNSSDDRLHLATDLFESYGTTIPLSHKDCLSCLQNEAETKHNSWMF